MRKALDTSETSIYLGLVVEIQWAMRQLMKERDITRAELARRMNLSRSRVSQFFNDYPNISLETLACIFFALGEKSIRLTSSGIRQLESGIRSAPEG